MEPHVPRPSPSTRSPSHMGWSPISGLIFFLSPEVQATIYLTYNTPLETLESPAIFNGICNDVGPNIQFGQNGHVKESVNHLRTFFLL